MKRFTRVSRARISCAPIVDRARIQATAARFDSKPIPWAFLWLWRGVRTAARPVRRRTREHSDAPRAAFSAKGLPSGRIGSHPHHRLDPVDVSVGFSIASAAAWSSRRASPRKVRQNRRIISVVVGANGDGRREILGLDIGASKAETFWTGFLPQACTPRPAPRQAVELFRLNQQRRSEARQISSSSERRRVKRR